MRSNIKKARQRNRIFNDIQHVQSRETFVNKHGNLDTRPVKCDDYDCEYERTAQQLTKDTHDETTK